MVRAHSAGSAGSSDGRRVDVLRAGQFAAALDAAKQAVDFDPDDARAYAVLGWAHLTRRSRRGNTIARAGSREGAGEYDVPGQLGEALALAGETAGARDILRQLEDLSHERHVSPYHFAYVHTGLGELIARRIGSWAYVDRGGSIYGVKGSFLFTPPREHPRFVALLTKMNLA